MAELILIGWCAVRGFYFSQHHKDSLRVTLRLWDSQGRLPGRQSGHWLRVHLGFCESCGRFSAMQNLEVNLTEVKVWEIWLLPSMPVLRLCCFVLQWTTRTRARMGEHNYTVTVTLDCWLGILFILHDILWIVYKRVPNHINKRFAVDFLVAVQGFELQELYDMHTEVKQHSGAMIAIVAGPRSTTTCKFDPQVSSQVLIGWAAVDSGKPCSFSMKILTSGSEQGSLVSTRDLSWPFLMLIYQALGDVFRFFLRCAREDMAVGSLKSGWGRPTLWHGCWSCSTLCKRQVLLLLRLSERNRETNGSAAFSALQYDTPWYITCGENTSFCATLCNDPLVSHCKSCCVAAPHLMKFFLFHSSTTKEVSARRIFVVLKAQKEMYLLNVSQGSSIWSFTMEWSLERLSNGFYASISLSHNCRQLSANFLTFWNLALKWPQLCCSMQPCRTGKGVDTMFHQLAGQLLDAHMIGPTSLWQQAPTPKKSISFGGNSEYMDIQ